MRLAKADGMFKSMLKTALATAAFGVIHSALASSAAKQTAERVLGTRVRNGLYRPVFVAQSIVGTAVLAKYVLGLPDRELYQARGRTAQLMRLGQIGGLLYLGWAAKHVGFRQVSGLESLQAWSESTVHVPREPEAQGPAHDRTSMRATGPFRHSRHPLNLSPLPVFWLQPRMTANLLAFNLVATAYLFLGSIHEEMRLRSVYGSDYEDYQQSGVPFYLPEWNALTARQPRRLRKIT